MNLSKAPIPTSRRDRNMQEKRRRILHAATMLFEEHGFDAVSTQEISELADIGVGTLFRYAASKNELLLLVYNEKLREALKRGADLARGATDPVEAILAMMSPLLELGRTSAENGTAYQRELLFGGPTEPHRLEGLALIADLEAAIASRLSEKAEQDRLPVRPDAARLASCSIFAVTHLAVSRKSTGAHRGYDPLDDLRGQITQIITGYLAALTGTVAARTQGMENCDERY